MPGFPLGLSLVCPGDPSLWGAGRCGVSLGPWVGGLTPRNLGGSNIWSVPHICSPGLCLAAMQKGSAGGGEEEEEGWGAKAAPICAPPASAEPLSTEGAAGTPGTPTGTPHPERWETEGAC